MTLRPFGRKENSCNRSITTHEQGGRLLCAPLPRPPRATSGLCMRSCRQHAPPGIRLCRLIPSEGPSPQRADWPHRPSAAPTENTTTTRTSPRPSATCPAHRETITPSCSTESCSAWRSATPTIMGTDTNEAEPEALLALAGECGLSESAARSRIGAASSAIEGWPPLAATASTRRRSADWVSPSAPVAKRSHASPDSPTLVQSAARA